jgi:hypothetical protein
LSPQCGDNLGTVFSALLSEEVRVAPSADLPVESSQRGVGGSCDPAARFVDHRPDFVGEQVGGWLRSKGSGCRA